MSIPIPRLLITYTDDLTKQPESKIKTLMKSGTDILSLRSIEERADGSYQATPSDMSSEAYRNTMMAIGITIGIVVPIATIIAVVLVVRYITNRRRVAGGSPQPVLQNTGAV